MHITNRFVFAGLAGLLINVAAVNANDRRFTYTYEPETLPAGAMEFEQWITLRTQRTANIGKDNYNRWEIREEFEYGVTDRYTAALYLNAKSENYEDPTQTTQSTTEFTGISLENRYMLLNPAEKPVGLTLYLEPKYSGDEVELEQIVILGQRHGDWKWALNLVHETEWKLNDHETEGVFEVDFGITRQLGKRWSLGLELRNRNLLPEYSKWENTALYIGPVLSYAQDKWWAALTILPQVWGKHTGGGSDPDGVKGLELSENERVNIRLLFGFGL